MAVIKVATDRDIELIKGHIYNIKFKLELLSNLYIVEQELQATARTVSNNISAESDIRRTASLVLDIDDEQFISDNFEINWLDKLVRFYIGLEQKNGEFVYYLLGTYLLDSDNARYDATSRELTLNLVDIMAVATQSRGNQIGADVLIPYNSNMKNAIISFVARFLPFKRYDVVNFPDTVPYDQEFSKGTYPYDVLNQLITLFPYYEQYYDTDGVYTVKEIPTGIGEDVFLDETVLDDLIISEERSGTIGNIKNSTEIWGAELDAMYTASNCLTVTEGENQTYILIMNIELQTIEPNSTFSFVPGDSNTATQYIQIQGVDGSYYLFDSRGDAIPAGTLVAGRSYVIKFGYVQHGQQMVGCFYLQGEEYIHVIVREMNTMPSAEEIAADKERNDCDNIKYVINPGSPYACDRNGKRIVEGEIRQVLQGGDYSYIYTTELAYERGAYENYVKARLNTAVVLKTVLIPWIDVNKKIQYTSPKTGEVHQYLVKEVDMNPTEFTMTMKLVRFYNAYPWL